MRWLELSVEADGEAIEAVSEILGRVSDGAAVQPTQLLRDPADELAAREDPNSPYIITAHMAADSDAAGRVDATERALWHLQAFGLRAVGQLRVRTVDDASWTDAWKRHYVAQRIGRVVIVPSWATEEELGSGEVAITLDPGMAFGTGLHPTTQQCLEALSELELAERSLLDVGTGSGILAIAAGKRGARPIVATDIDELAVPAARENCERNGIDADIVVGSAADVSGTFDVVVANIVAATLQSIARDLRARLAPGGTLVLAGIVAEKESGTAAAFTLIPVARAQRDDWVSLVLR